MGRICWHRIDKYRVIGHWTRTSRSRWSNGISNSTLGGSSGGDCLNRNNPGTACREAYDTCCRGCSPCKGGTGNVRSQRDKGRTATRTDRLGKRDIGDCRCRIDKDRVIGHWTRTSRSRWSNGISNSTLGGSSGGDCLNRNNPGTACREAYDTCCRGCSPCKGGTGNVRSQRDKGRTATRTDRLGKRDIGDCRCRIDKDRVIGHWTRTSRSRWSNGISNSTLGGSSGGDCLNRNNPGTACREAYDTCCRGCSPCKGGTGNVRSQRDKGRTATRTDRLGKRDIGDCRCRIDKDRVIGHWTRTSRSRWSNGISNSTLGGSSGGDCLNRNNPGTACREAYDTCCRGCSPCKGGTGNVRSQRDKGRTATRTDRLGKRRIGDCRISTFKGYRGCSCIVGFFSCIVNGHEIDRHCGCSVHRIDCNGLGRIA